MIYSRVAGTGSHLPEKIVSNFDLEKLVDTTDEWIRTRTGIERRINENGPDNPPGCRSAQSNDAPGPGAGGAEPAERDVRLVVDRLLVDVDDAGGDLPGQVEAAHHVPGQDA